MPDQPNGSGSQTDRRRGLRRVFLTVGLVGALVVGLIASLAGFALFGCKGVR